MVALPRRRDLTRAYSGHAHVDAIDRVRDPDYYLSKHHSLLSLC